MTTPTRDLLAQHVGRDPMTIICKYLWRLTIQMYDNTISRFKPAYEGYHLRKFISIYYWVPYSYSLPMLCSGIYVVGVKWNTIFGESIGDYVTSSYLIFPEGESDANILRQLRVKLITPPPVILGFHHFMGQRGNRYPPIIRRDISIETFRNIFRCRQTHAWGRWWSTVIHWWVKLLPANGYIISLRWFHCGYIPDYWGICGENVICQYTSDVLEMYKIISDNYRDFTIDKWENLS